MVRIITTEIIDVQSYIGMVDKALKKLVEQIDIKFTDTGTLELDVVFHTRATGKIDDHPRQCFIQRHIGMAIAYDAFFITDGLAERLSQGNTDIFNRVVCIDVQITFCLDLKIDQTMTRHLVQHVLEKRHTRIEFTFTRTVQVYFDLNLSFQCIAFHSCLTLRHFFPTLISVKFLN